MSLLKNDKNSVQKNAAFSKSDKNSVKKSKFASDPKKHNDLYSLRVLASI